MKRFADEIATETLLFYAAKEKKENFPAYKRFNKTGSRVQFFR